MLVVGAGSGNEIIQLAEGRPHWSFTGIDPSESMLTIAKERLLTLPNDMSFHQATILDASAPLLSMMRQVVFSSCILFMIIKKSSKQ